MDTNQAATKLAELRLRQAAHQLAQAEARLLAKYGKRVKRFRPTPVTPRHGFNGVVFNADGSRVMLYGHTDWAKQDRIGRRVNERSRLTSKAARSSSKRGK